MPDLQSELAKVLTQAQFDDEPGAPAEVTTVETPVEATKPTSLRERLWNWVRDNPGVSCPETSKALGLDVTATANDLLKMTARGLLERRRYGGCFHYTVVGDAYPQFDKAAHLRTILPASIEARRANSVKKARKAKKATVKKPKAQPIKVDEKPTRTLEQMKQALAPQIGKFDADAIINQLNVLQAKELLVRLREVFGI